MNFFVLILFFSLFIFLYVVYSLSKEDFVILRNNISMEKIFNAAILSFVVGVFSARLIFVIDNPDPIYRSILGFILFPYFPGLSLSGGIIGALVFSYIYFRTRLIPVERLMDFFSFAFISSFPVGLTGYLILNGQKIAPPQVTAIAVAIMYLIIFIKFILPSLLGSKFKDATFTLITISSFFLIYILIRFLLADFKIIIDIENTISIVLFLLSFTFLIKRERLLKKTAEGVVNLRRKYNGS